MYNQFGTENELQHHGIKGQKWGVRRKLRSTLQARKLKKEDSKNKKAEKSVDKSTSNKKPSISTMSNKELQERVTRLQLQKQLTVLEREISSLNAKQVSVGKRFIQSVGKDVITPAAKDAGKKLLTNYAVKIGTEAIAKASKASK